MMGWLHDRLATTDLSWMLESGSSGLTPLQALVLLAGIPACLLLARLLSSLVRRFTLFLRYRRTGPSDLSPVLYFHNSIYFVIGMLLLSVLFLSLSLTGWAEYGSGILLRSGWTLTVSWFFYRALTYVTGIVEHRMGGSKGEAWRIRGVRTQMIILRRVAGFIVLVFAVSILLLQFEIVQKVGISLLASAGVAGIVIGLAAQKSIASILYGIQLALTQPVRIGDTVIIEGQWGQVEEIHLTYLVLRIWDERRLVVPVEHILSQPFENWTRTSPQILGAVFINVDFKTPVSQLRQSFQDFLKGQPLWDGRVCSLQVTDMKEHCVQLRALVSAADASSAWDLRCLVREWFMVELASLDGGRYLPVLPVRSDGPDMAQT